LSKQDIGKAVQSVVDDNSTSVPAASVRGEGKLLEKCTEMVNNVLGYDEMM